MNWDKLNDGLCLLKEKLELSTLEDLNRSLDSLLLSERKTKIDQVLGQRRLDLTCVLDRVHNLGNINACIRSAEAFGLQTLQLISDGNFKRQERTTQGAHKWMHLLHHSSSSSCMKLLKEQGYQILVTGFDKNARPIGQVPLENKVAIILGNELEGCHPDLVSQADHTVYIPMRGFSQSFNISVACAILLYEISKRLERKPLDSYQSTFLQAFFKAQSLNKIPQLALDQLLEKQAKLAGQQ